MERKRINKIYAKQMEDKVLAVLADLCYNNYGITWDCLLTIINFLKENKAYGPKGIDTIIMQLCKMNLRLLDFLGENTSSLLSDIEKHKMRNLDILVSYLNQSEVWKDKMDLLHQYKSGTIPLENVGIRFPLMANGGVQTLGVMVGREHFYLFDRIANDFSSIRKAFEPLRTDLHSFVLRRATGSLSQAEVLLQMDSYDYDLSALHEHYEVLRDCVHTESVPSNIGTIRLNNEDSRIKEIYWSSTFLEKSIGEYQQFFISRHLNEGKVFKLQTHLRFLKEKMEMAHERVTDLEQKFYLRCYICMIDNALESENIQEMERLCNGVIVRKKEKKKEKLA